MATISSASATSKPTNFATIWPMVEDRIRASAIIIQDNKLLLIHRLNHGQEYYVLPGGGIDAGETAEQAVIREVKEETNLDVIAVGLAFYTDKYDDQKFIHPSFVCQVNPGEAKFMGTEATYDPENKYETKWVNLYDISTLQIYPPIVKTKLLEMHEN